MDSLAQHDLRLANANAAVWAVGNGLVSTTLVMYLAIEFGARGLAVSLILAAPRLAGLTRLFTPTLLAVFRARKAMCIAAFLCSAAALMAMLLVAVPGRAPTASAGVSALVVGWCVYHALEYVGAVLLWSWLGDLMPRGQRGHLIGQRERWLVGGRVIGIGVSLAMAFGWQRIEPTAARWVPLVWSAGLGSGLLLLANAPLAFMQRRGSTPSAAPRATWRAIGRCFADRAFRRLITFSCFFSLANGVTAVAQSLYPVRVLGLRYEHTMLMRAAMRTGQAAIAPALGERIDRRGAKRVMFVSQLIAATGPLFFWLATAKAPWWIAGAYVAWIAYAGLNVGLDQQKLAVAPDDNNSPAIAAYHAISSLADGVMIVLGGLAFDRLTAGGESAMALYGQLFLAGWVARTLAAGLLLRLVEHPAGDDSTPPA